MRNCLPNWLNLLFILVILALAVYGAIIFMGPSFIYKPEIGFYNLKPFFSSGIVTSLYTCILFVTALFTNYELSTVIFLVLLIAGLIIFSLGFCIRDSEEKSVALHIGSGILGLGLGIPFGEKIRVSKGESAIQN